MFLNPLLVQFHHPFRKRFEALAHHCPISLAPILIFSEISGMPVFLLASVWRYLTEASIGQGGYIRRCCGLRLKEVVLSTNRL